jgi:hypothetical protein
MADNLYCVPLPGGEREFTITVPLPVTEAEWDHFLTVLAAMKPGLVKDAEAALLPGT